MSDPHPPHRLELYRWAVQDPYTQARVLDHMYRRLYPGREPRCLREDFAGNAADSVAWVGLGGQRQALAVDLDAATLDWGAARAQRLLGADAGRIAFHAADVMHLAPPQVPAAQVLAALNFSLFYFHRRDQLRAYLTHARRCLDPQGLLVANAYGGSEGLRARVETQTVVDRLALPGETAPPPFDYQWEQGPCDALTHRARCCIHFRGPGPQVLREAFVYDWRLWSLPELVELAQEAGFRRVEVWRHTHDPSRGAAGVFLGPVSSLTGVDTWVAYLVAMP